jgi:hypothetical protein
VATTIGGGCWRPGLVDAVATTSAEETVDHCCEEVATTVVAGGTQMLRLMLWRPLLAGGWRPAAEG